MASRSGVEGVILDQPMQNKNVAKSGPPSLTLVPPPHRDWTVGMCYCCKNCDWGGYAFFCYFCVLHQITKAMQEHTCLPCLPICGLLALRTKIRSMYGIQGSGCRDCCLLTFCNGCGACQMHRELVGLGVIDQKRCSTACRQCCRSYK